MSNLLKSLMFFFVSFNIFSGGFPDCKTQNGKILSGTADEVNQIMHSKANRPQMYATGTVYNIQEDDTKGLPHQRYNINVENGQKDIDLVIVSNLEFGKVPVKIGDSVTVCGEFINAEGGMIHWTHYQTRSGTHPNGFTIFNGVLYGEKEVKPTDRNGFFSYEEDYLVE
jgi:hypothetical protein